MRAETVVTKHTEGPWLLQRVSEIIGEREREVYEVSSDATALWIAYVQIPLLDPPESYKQSFEANAKLIVAAPELLAALKEAHKYFRNRTGNEEIQLNEICGVAIAKAEGR